MTSALVQRITPRRHADARGWFSEVYMEQRYRHLGIDCRFVQDNHSYSVAPYTLRGMHFQRPPQAQDKLVRCVRGRVFDVAVDIRADSPTFGRWVGAELSHENGDQMFIPVGFAHGFLTLEPHCEVVYKVSNIYAPDCDVGLRWDGVDIAWPLPPGITPVLSAKDANLPLLNTLVSPFSYDGRPLGGLVQV